MNNNERGSLRWYLQGAKDSKTAEKNARAGDFEISCFLFQQAAEKVGGWSRSSRCAGPGEEHICCSR